jgi:hypothetical protein
MITELTPGNSHSPIHPHHTHMPGNPHPSTHPTTHTHTTHIHPTSTAAIFSRFIPSLLYFFETFLSVIHLFENFAFEILFFWYISYSNFCFSILFSSTFFLSNFGHHNKYLILISVSLKYQYYVWNYAFNTFSQITFQLK